MSPRLLARKLLGRLLGLLRLAPALRRAELHHYLAIERALLGGESVAALPVWRRLLPLPPAPAIRQLLEAESPYRMVDPRHLSDADASLLRAHGIDLRLLRANAGVIDASGRVPADTPSTAGGSRTIEFQHHAFAQAGIQAVCPISGRPLKSDRSLLAEQNQPIYYWFAGAQPFLMAVGREGQGYIKLYLYFPRLRTAFLLSDAHLWHGRDEIDQIRAFIIAHWRLVSGYLARTDRPMVCALVDNQQFAHHIWNVLSGIERLIREDRLATIDTLVVAAEPIAPLDGVFPELRQSTITRWRFPQLVQIALERNCLLIRPGDVVIPDRVPTRLHHYAAAVAPRRVREDVAALRASCWPILWVTVRVDNRTWVAQTAGIIAIARRLAADHPGAALIIDGFCRLHGDAGRDTPEQRRIIGEELAAARAIESAVSPMLPVRSTIGGTLIASVNYAAIADCYFVHAGSLQHKIGWLTDAPGVVHGNRLVLSNPQHYRRPMGARPGAALPRFLPAALVTDVPGARRIAKNRWLDDLDNYDFDPMDGYRMLQAVIQGLQRGSPSHAGDRPPV